MIAWIVIVAFVLLFILDLAGLVNLVHPIPMAIYLPLAINLPLVYFFLYELQGRQGWFSADRTIGFSFWVAMILLGLAVFAIWLRLNIAPIRDKQKTGFRLKAMAGARPLLYGHIYAALFEVLFLALAYPRIAGAADVMNFRLGGMLAGNGFYALGCCFVLFLNGILRAFLLSRRFTILRRVLLFFTLWIPIINWLVWLRSAKLLKDEYEYGAEKQRLNATRVESDLCRTTYPLLLLHGVAFRDMRYFNYWGRVPRILKRYGAEIYYGNQEALGTIEENGADIKLRIENILRETGAEKVNIIAHSKGGLDARYAIAAFGLGDKVASLTTMNTPHRGCRFADKATAKLPEGIYRKLARLFDSAFRKYGDQHPDFYTATKQFCTDRSDAFNERYPDAEGVYYQSFTSVMTHMSSDALLSLPWFFIRKLGEENDGLVSIESAKWGNFRTVFRTKQRRGISHGDVIDLKREDIKGFDVAEVYVGIVSELRGFGF